MIPDSLAPEVPGSERYVYNRLRTLLPESWTVVHGRRFVLPGDGHPIEGELDFLVLDPTRGALCLEVKGGGIQRRSGGWFSVDRNREAHSIKDPGLQVSNAMHAILRYLRDSKGFGQAGFRCRMGWGVLFPDADAPTDLGPDLPRSFVIDRSDLADLRRAVDRMFDSNGLDGPALGPPATKALLDALLPTCHLIPSLAARLQQEESDLIRLTDEQMQVLDMLEANTRVAIEGAAGTGKTVLALEKARRLAEQGQRTLLTCFNRPLADHLQRFASAFEVASFHEICREMASRAGLDFAIPRGPRQQKLFWENEAPMLLLEALEAVPDRYDALVVDEGQDFRADWWPAILELLSDPASGTIYVFFDPHQNIYGGGPPEALQVAPTRLVYNCRNTSRIAEYTASIVGASTKVRPGAPQGAAVETIRCTSESEMVDKVRKTLHRLVSEESISTDQIVVLSTHSPSKSALGKHRQLGNLHLVPPDAQRRPNTVIFTSLHRFKGLESDVVVLVDVREGEYTSGPEHLYVGASRARHLLVVAQQV